MSAPPAGRGALPIVVASLGVAAVNYLLSLALIRVLPVPDIAKYAAMSGAALAVGSALGAGLPAAIGAAHARGEHVGADRFAVRASAVAAVLSVPVLAVYGGIVAGAAGALALAAAAGVLVVAPIGTSRMVGMERRSRLAVGRVVEAAIRLGVGLAGGIVAGAPGAIVGIVAGTGVFAAVGIAVRPPKGVDAPLHRLAADAVTLTVVFGLVAAAGSLDVIVLPLVVGSTPASGSYAAAAFLSRAPYFVAAGLAAAFYAPLAARRAAGEAGSLVRSALLVAAPGALLVASLPSEIARIAIPTAGASGEALLPALALTGFGAALFVVGASLVAATGRRAASLVYVSGGVAIACLAIAAVAKESLFGAALLDGTILGAAGLVCLRACAPWRHAILSAFVSVVPVAALAALPLVVEPLVGRNLIVWAVVSAVVGVTVLRDFLRAAPESLLGKPARPLRILHLAYEDPCAPGAGGGSRRTAEIAKRLVADGTASWTAVCRKYPGAAPHILDGVSYRHIGLPGRFAYSSPKRAAIGYFAALPFAFPYLLARFRPDIVVEDFGAPISTFGIGRLTRRPVVGVVQWLNAAEKSKEYGLPFGAVEEFGLRAHRRLVAVSDDLAAELRRRSPSAVVKTVRNGVDEDAFGPLPDVPSGMRRGDIAFLGRIEIAQKGLDMLIDAYAMVAADIEADLVLAGVGVDEASLKSRAAEAGVAGRVRFIGHLDGPRKFAFLSAASVVAMPSRFETFGLVAAEAAAVGTPVVAFDIPSLREVVLDGKTGVLVEAFDVAAYAAALRDLVADRPRRERMRPACLELGASLRWGAAAEGMREVLGEAMLKAAPAGGAA